MRTCIERCKCSQDRSSKCFTRARVCIGLHRRANELEQTVRSVSLCSACDVRPSSVLVRQCPVPSGKPRDHSVAFDVPPLWGWFSGSYKCRCCFQTLLYSEYQLNNIYFMFSPFTGLFASFSSAAIDRENDTTTFNSTIWIMQSQRVHLKLIHLRAAIASLPADDRSYSALPWAKNGSYRTPPAGR